MKASVGRVKESELQCSHEVNELQRWKDSRNREARLKVLGKDHMFYFVCTLIVWVQCQEFIRFYFKFCISINQ